jgi:hypothetical protein
VYCMSFSFWPVYFLSFSFWSVYFLSFSICHCVVCSSSIYGFWLPLLYLQTLLTTHM